ncbi:acyl carrier protein [endosymbiont 'TC1' of Trimyema compressum]|uniref:acyl carrier protein n=1 Tax=endosymbiont 'TC1' of Trimyema compressum TaxID=243899 RepID=UPI0007F0CD39|nr:acyl carrier protein [endosymbiont 'TC1' of Trimyema compressum]AMP21437.1 acyl carrier protein [endosymbiont 'TC1' of Trimyema compressum]
MEKRIKEILAEELSADIDEITLETNLKEDLNADSIDMMQVIDVLEQEFDTEVDTSELAAIVTVGDIVNYIESKK